MTKEETLTSFLIETQARSYRLAYSVLHNREEALDAVQTAVCKALERQDTLKDPKAVRSWFYRMLVNVCLDMLRQKSRVIPFPESLETEGYEDPLPDDTLSRQVDALPEAMGTVIRLRFYEELSLNEISKITGENLSTVKSRLYAALKKLRISMEGALG